MPTAQQEEAAPGILGQMGSTAHTLLGFFQARAQLLALEAREGIHSLKVNATLLSLGILFVLLGYVGAIAAGISLVARKSGIPWETILLWIALPHLLIGAALVWIGRDRLFQPLFDCTLEELEKDQRWIRRNLPSNGERLS